MYTITVRKQLLPMLILLLNKKLGEIIFRYGQKKIFFSVCATWLTFPIAWLVFVYSNESHVD